MNEKLPCKIVNTLNKMFIFGGRKKRLKKPKLTKKEIETLNWGEIEKRLGIESSKEPPRKIKMKIMQDSVFARECKWFSNKDIEKWLKKEDKILKSFNRTFKKLS